MNETGISSQINSLSWLIPTGENDIAVREVLIPIFGNAVSCKVPGAPCTTVASFETATSSGELVASIFSVFNAGTLVFCTVLLIFIALVGFMKTASDGEFFGKSWNTTFTALRLVAGIGFILPMPNNYSTIQNFVMYVGLWSSGFANQLNLATSEHYLARLQNNMIKGDSNASSLEGEAKDLLLMHICASTTQRLYGAQGVNLRMEKTSTSELVRPYTSTPDINPMGDNTGAVNTTPAYEKTRTELAYIERGTYLASGSLPCGRVVMDATIDPAMEIKIASAIPKNAWGSSSLPLTDKARDMIANELAEVASNARSLKGQLIQDMASQNSPLRGLADKIVSKYASLQIIYNDDGSIKSAPAASTAGGVSAEEAIKYAAEYTTIVRKANQDLINGLNSYRTQILEKGKGENGADSFFGQMKILLQDGGWMGTAATYRTMLDMTSLQFIAESQKPFKIESRDEAAQSTSTNVSGGLPEQLRTVNSMVNKILESDTAKTIYLQQQMNPPGVTNAVAPTSEGLSSLVTKKASMNEVVETIYGGGFLQNFRASVLRTLSISADYEPLYQIKSLGDRLALTSESLIGGEMLARGAMAGFIIAETTYSESIIGKAGNLVGTGVAKGIAEALKYLSESIFSLTRTMASGLAILAYAFSTWIPAIPFVAFLLAQLGWLFGLIMTLFAINLWGVMHITPARQDSFIGSEAQGYLLLLALFFRPAIATAALSLSFIVAPPVMKLINITLLPMLMANGTSTNVTSVFMQLFFSLVLYMVIVKGAILMIFMTPQSFPDDVMRIISAGIGDLGQSKAMSTMEAGEGSGRAMQQTMDGMSQAGSDRFKGLVNQKKKEKEDAVKKAEEKAAIKNLGGSGLATAGGEIRG